MIESKMNLETVLNSMDSCKKLLYILVLENFAASLKIVDTTVSTDEDLSEIFDKDEKFDIEFDIFLNQLKNLDISLNKIIYYLQEKNDR